MTFANVGTIGVQPGHRDDVIAILSRHNPQLAAAGCLTYEVGVDEDQPDTVFVAELWTSREAHDDSLQLESVKEAIAEAMPMLTGDMGGHRVEVVGSPLRD